MEYEFILNTYADDSYRALSVLPDHYDVSSREKATAFLDKYWLSNSEYENTVRQIENKMFVTNVGLPSMVINQGYEIFPMTGGAVIDEKEFLHLQKYLYEIGEDYFYIIEETNTKGFIPIRLKFPSNITWEELSSGSYISMILQYYLYGTFRLFGSSDLWGRYTDNHLSTDIWCFKKPDKTDFVEYLRNEMINDESFLLKKHFQPNISTE